MPDAEPTDKSGPENSQGGRRFGDAVGRLRSKAILRWHLLAFVAVNAILSLMNAVIGGGWWAFWPLFGTALLLATHYFFHKALTVDEGWADERVEELNLKSYDRAHIEELKTRLGPSMADERDTRHRS